MDPEDRSRVIEILQQHYSPENVLLTEPTPVEIYRERTQQFEVWEVVLWNLKNGEFLAWRRDGGLKARPLVPDSMGMVRGVQIAVPTQRPSVPLDKGTSASGVADQLDDEITQALAEDYLKEIERKLNSTRRGSLEPYGGSFGAALRDMERSLRERREAERQERRWQE